METIEVDEEVLAFLKRDAEPFVELTPNDVLRRRLLGAGAKPSTAPLTRRGPLSELIEAGYIAGGDALRYEQTRKGNTHHAEVLVDGRVRANGKEYDRMSPSLVACVGYQINGWLWVHEPTGERLFDMKKRLQGQKQQG